MSFEKPTTRKPTEPISDRKLQRLVRMVRLLQQDLRTLNVLHIHLSEKAREMAIEAEGAIDTLNHSLSSPNWTESDEDFERMEMSVRALLQRFREDLAEADRLCEED